MLERVGVKDGGREGSEPLYNSTSVTKISRKRQCQTRQQANPVRGIIRTQKVGDAEEGETRKQTPVAPPTEVRARLHRAPFPHVRKPASHAIGYASGEKCGHRFNSGIQLEPG